MDRSVLGQGVDLERLARERAKDYRSAEPFAHIVLDGLFSSAILERLLADFPKPGEIQWRRFQGHNEIKLASSTEEQIPQAIRQFLYQLNSSAFLNFLEALTGISGLLPDPHFVGGGMHQILPGGKLAIHADFNKHPKFGLDRRLNLLLYLNRDWQEEYGGHLELWDRQMTACEKRISPVFNRMVVFSTTDFSYHGHPQPLACPTGRTRKSLALYYYSNGRPDEERSKGHSTLYRRLPTDSLFARYVAPFLPPVAYTLFDKIRRR